MPEIVWVILAGTVTIWLMVQIFGWLADRAIDRDLGPEDDDDA